MAYKIYFDNTCVSNSMIDDSIFIKPVIKNEANKSGTMTFTIPTTHAYYDHVTPLIQFISVVRDDENIFNGIVTGISEDINKQRKVTCEGILTFLNDSILRPHKYTNMNVRSLLEAYINEHNSQVDAYKRFTIGVVDVTATETILRYTNMNNTMKEIKEDLIDNYGGYLRARRVGNINYLDYLKSSPHTSDQKIKLGVNLLSYESNIDKTDICTVLIPLGTKLDTSPVEGLEARLDIKSVNDGKDYIQASNDILSRFGRINKVKTWDDVTIASNLKTKGEQYLNSQQFDGVYIKCKALDLGYIADVQKFRMLDMIRVISDKHGMDKNFMLTKMSIDLNEPSNDVFEFGSEFTVKLTTKSNTVNRVAQQLDNIPSSTSIIQQAVQNATALIAGAEGGHIVIEDENGKPARILIMDSDSKASARSIIQLNKNGIGFSTDGGRTYRNAWTIDGNLVADFITTGNLVGLNINNGNGTFKVDSNGNMLANSGKIGSWNIATEGADKGALYADAGDRRVWLHAGGVTSEGIRRFVFSVQKKKADGSYDTLFSINDDGYMQTTNNIDLYNASIGIFNDNGYSFFADEDGNITNNGYLYTLGNNTVDGYIQAKGNIATSDGSISCKGNIETSNGAIKAKSNIESTGGAVGVTKNGQWKAFLNENGLTAIKWQLTTTSFIQADLNTGNIELQTDKIKLSLQADGNLVLYKNGQPVWATGTGN